MPGPQEILRSRSLRFLAGALAGATAITGVGKASGVFAGAHSREKIDVVATLPPEHLSVLQLQLKSLNIAARVCHINTSSNYEECLNQIVPPPELVHIESISPPILAKEMPAIAQAYHPVVIHYYPPSKLLRRIGGCESAGSPNAPINYTAQNHQFPDVTGGYQDKNSTWNNYDGYIRAMDAPPAVQDQFNENLLGPNENTAPWQSSESCWQ